MILENKNIGKYKYIIYALMVAIGVSIPLTLGAIGDNTEKLKSHYRDSIESIKSQIKEACKWQQAILLDKNKTLIKAGDIVENANELKKVQTDCTHYIGQTVFQ